MKKILILLSFVLVLLLSGCGKKEVKGAAVFTSDLGSMKVVITLDAKGDVVTNFTQDTTIYTEYFTDEEIEAFEIEGEYAKESYGQVPNIVYEITKTEGMLLEKIIIPLDSATLKKAIELDLLPVDGENVQFISLKDTITNMESSGWEVEVKE